MTEQEIRSHFPFLSTGRIYMNHASTAPLSTYVGNKIQEQLEIRSRGVIECYPDTVRMITETREMLANMIHCTPDRIAFVQNTSDGLNILASGIDWKTGDRVLLNDAEFPANVYPFLNQKKHGVEIDFIKSPNGMIRLDDIGRAITHRTRLLSISWVQFLSGFKGDLDAISDLCKKHGIIFCVDAIQGLGALQLDLSRCEIDFLSAGAQKWLMAPQGIGFIYLSSELQSRLGQSTVGWLGVKNAWDFFEYDLDLLDSASRYEGGTKNTIGIAGFNGALTFFRDVGCDVVESRVLSNANRLYQMLEENGFDILTPKEQGERAGIVTFRHEQSVAIFKFLAGQRIDVSHRIGAIRISPHFYNTHEEVARVSESIQYFLNKNYS